MNAEQFVSEPIEPRRGSFDAAGMARGEPGLPRRFTWRQTEYEVDELLEAWTTSSPEGGHGEMYLRRHWFKLRTTDGTTMTIYCERQPKPGQSARRRWWVYSVG